MLSIPKRNCRPQLALGTRTPWGLERDFFGRVVSLTSAVIPIYGETHLYTQLGGMGAWLPEWNKTGEKKHFRRERSIAEPGLGQTGSSTRQELAAFIIVMTLPYRINFASDSASMVGKANLMIKLAQRLQRDQAAGHKVNMERTRSNEPRQE